MEVNTDNGAVPDTGLTDKTDENKQQITSTSVCDIYVDRSPSEHFNPATLFATLFISSTHQRQ